MAKKDSKTTAPAATTKPATTTPKAGDDAANKAELEAKKAAEKAAAEKAKADAKAKKDAEKAAKDAEKAKAKAAKAAEAAKAKAEKEAKRAEAQKALDAARAKADEAKAAAKAARELLRGTGGGGTKGPDALRTYATQYVKDTEHKTASGNPSVHCNDEVAQKLLGKPLEEVYATVAKAIDEDVAALKAKYGHLNLGMQRMNLGNRLRGVLNAK